MSAAVVRSDHAEVWRCAECKHVCLDGELFVAGACCPECGSEHVFPALDRRCSGVHRLIIEKPTE